MNSHGPLHNIVTQQLFPVEITKSVLNLLTSGKEICTTFRKERLIDKSAKMSAKITKQNTLLLTYQPKPTEAPKQGNEITPKDVALAQRHIEIAKQRGLTIEKILTYDLLPYSPLFEGDYPVEPSKYQLVSEVEDMVPKTILPSWKQNSDLRTHVVVDFMSKVRQLKMNTFTTLGELCDQILSSSLKLSPDVEILHMVLDSYKEKSLKECERTRRSSVAPIDIVGMTTDTLIPQQIDKFWASSRNKESLQSLLPAVARRYNKPVLVSSKVIEEEIRPACLVVDGDVRVVNELSNSWLEEADERLILHVDWAVIEKKCERVIVDSNDADTFALLLYFLPYLKTKGLKELWQQYGRGDKKRIIPLHALMQHLGETFVKIVLPSHILSGDDIMSKAGTKKSALTSGDPLSNLLGFAEQTQLTENDILQAEKYLVRVWSGVRKTNATTFDKLRLEYHTCYSQGIDGLPPTSSVIRGHIRRGAFCVRHKRSLIGVTKTDSESPEENEWHTVFGMYLPKKNLSLLPEGIIATCNCGSDCTTKRCKCMKAGQPCVIFCHGKKQTPCLNVKH